MRILATLLLISLGAAGAVLYGTRHGPFFVSDSALYIGPARNALEGRGLTAPVTTRTSVYRPSEAAAFEGAVPLTAVPPLFPAVLTLGAPFGLDPVEWARFVLAACLAGSLLLSGIFAIRLAGGAWPPAIATMGLLVAGPGIADPIGPVSVWAVLHTTVLSEALFILCSLASLLALVRYLEQPSIGRLVAAALLTALALLTRYAGISIVAAGTVVLLAHHARRWPDRLRDSLVFASLALSPLLAWVVNLMWTTASALPRPLSVHLLTAADFWTCVLTISAWFLPTSVGRGPALLVVALVVGTVIAAMVRRLPPRLEASPETERDRSATSRVLVIYVLVYLAVIGLVTSFFDAIIHYEQRILSPILPAALALSTSSFFTLASGRGLRVVTAVLLITTLGLIAPQAAKQAQLMAHPPMLQQREWRQALSRDLQDLPPDTFIASNATEGLYLSTGRRAIQLPRTWRPHSAAPNLQFRAELRELRRLLRDREGVVVLLRSPDPYLPIRRVRSVLRLEEIQKTRRAAIYRVAKQRVRRSPRVRRSSDD